MYCGKHVNKIMNLLSVVNLAVFSHYTFVFVGKSINTKVHWNWVLDKWFIYEAVTVSVLVFTDVICVLMKLGNNGEILYLIIWINESAFRCAI